MALKGNYKFTMFRRERTAFQAEGTAGTKAVRYEGVYACTMTRIYGSAKRRFWRSGLEPGLR